MWKRRVVWIAVGTAVVAGVWMLLRPRPVAVETAVIGRGPVAITIDEDGETRVRDRYVVDAPVTGRLRRVAIREGDPVAKGSVLAELDPAPLDARAREEGEARLEASIDAQRVARAALERARAALEQAGRERDRAARLFQQGLVASETRERSDLAAQAARKDLEAAEYRARSAAHEVEVARAAITPRADGGTVVVRAPVDGRVLRVNEPSERVVLAGTALVEVGDPADLEVVADLLSSDAVRVAIGDTVEVEGWGGDSTLVGTVRLIEPSGFTKVSALGVEEQRVNVVATIHDPPPGLGDRFHVTVRIVLWHASDVLRVPRGAVFRARARWGAFLVRGGVAARRELEVGHRGGEFFEVLGGVEAGDVVVLYPDERIRDGVRVRAHRP